MSNCKQKHKQTTCSDMPTLRNFCVDHSQNKVAATGARPEGQKAEVEDGGVGEILEEGTASPASPAGGNAFFSVLATGKGLS